MAIIMHPLTAQNGSPEYTADDYRHAINPLLVPSGWYRVQRFVWNPPRFPESSGHGERPYRYGQTSLRYHQPVGRSRRVHLRHHHQYDRAVGGLNQQLQDRGYGGRPSQSHGTTPRGKIEVFPAGTPDSNINGLVIAKVNAGVASDAAPMIRNNAVLMARDLNQLNTIDAVDGQEAVTMADNAH